MDQLPAPPSYEELEQNWKQYRIESMDFPRMPMTDKYDKCLGLRNTQYGPGLAFRVRGMKEEFPNSISILRFDLRGYLHDAACGDMHIGWLRKIEPSA